MIIEWNALRDAEVVSTRTELVAIIKVLIEPDYYSVTVKTIPNIKIGEIEYIAGFNKERYETMDTGFQKIFSEPITIEEVLKRSK